MPREALATPATAALGSKGGGATRCDRFLGGWDRDANDCAPFPALPRDGVQVVATHSLAASSDHRVRSISTIIDDINNARRSLYGTLAKKAADLRLPKD